MRSVARIGTHPIHPMLVGFPIALWTSSFLSDVWFAYTDRLHFVGYWLAIAGCVAAVFAAIPGLIDLFGATAPGSPARGIAWRHGLLNIAALVLFAVSVLLRPAPEYMSYGAYITAGLGMLCIAISGWLGGTLIYDHRVGVPEAPGEHR